MAINRLEISERFLALTATTTTNNLFADVWLLVKFLEDGIMSVVRGLEVENEESGDSAKDTLLHPDAVCLAPYQHGAYQAVIFERNCPKNEVFI